MKCILLPNYMLSMHFCLQGKVQSHEMDFKCLVLRLLVPLGFLVQSHLPVLVTTEIWPKTETHGFIQISQTNVTLISLLRLKPYRMLRFLGLILSQFFPI